MINYSGAKQVGTNFESREERNGSIDYPSTAFTQNSRNTKKGVGATNDQTSRTINADYAQNFNQRDKHKFE